MNRLRKYRPVITQAYDPLCETTTAFDVTNKRLTRLIQPTQKTARLISNVHGDWRRQAPCPVAPRAPEQGT